MPNSTVSGSVDVAGETYNYNEVKYGNRGGGNRGIRVYCGSRDQTYKFRPNPHDSREYNRKQAAFYEQATEAIVGIMTRNSLFPRYGKKVTVMGVEYTLEPR